MFAMHSFTKRARRSIGIFSFMARASQTRIFFASSARSIFSGADDFIPAERAGWSTSIAPETSNSKIIARRMRGSPLSNGKIWSLRNHDRHEIHHCAYSGSFAQIAVNHEPNVAY